VYEDDTFVDVRWGFFAFPATLVAATTLFLIALITVSATGGRARVARSWKSDLLPFLLGGLSLEGASLESLSTDKPTSAAQRSMQDLATQAGDLTGKLNLGPVTDDSASKMRTA